MTVEEISSVDPEVVARRKREIVPAESAAEPAAAPG